MNLNILYAKLIIKLHIIYLIFASIGVISIAMITPPFQVPDEENHFMRSEQVSRIELIANYHVDSAKSTASKLKFTRDSTVLYPKPGGYRTARVIPSSGSYFRSLYFHPSNKINPVKLAEAKKLMWSKEYIFWNFGNTAIYCPLVYTMPAIGIYFGKTLNIPVIDTLYISRLFNGICCIVISCIGIRVARATKLLQFIVLLFPMTMALYGSVSQDAVLICCSFLVISLIDYNESNQKFGYESKQLILIGVLIALIGLSKLPYLSIVLLIPFLSISIKQKICLTCLPCLIVIIWLILDRDTLAVAWAPPEMHINAKLQVEHILQNPFRYLGLFFKIDLKAIFNNARMFVGVLGWADLWFSRLYYGVAFIILMLGLTAFDNLNSKTPIRLKIAALCCTLVMLFAVMSVQYITWTALDLNSLYGMQGRYLLPIFPVLALSLGNLGFSFQVSKHQALAAAGILTFPIITIIVVIEGVLSRFY